MSQPQLGAVGIAIITAVLIAVAYNSYRYPLQINSTITSPTYSDTPIAFTMGKYVVFAIITYFAALCAPFELRHPLLFSKRQGVLLYTIAWLTLITSFHALQGGGIESFQTIAPVLCIFPLVIFMSAWIYRRSSAESLGRICLAIATILLVVHTAANLFQVLAYQTTGRLPALGYAGLVVRFGGLWDDPNSTAAYSAAFIIFLASRRISLERRLCNFLVGCGLLNLTLAWSYSGWLVLVSGLLFLFMLRLRQRVLFASLLLVLVALGAMWLTTASASFSAIPVVGRIMELKHRGSIESRLLAVDSYFDRFGTANAIEWAVGFDRPPSAEAAVLAWLGAVGLIGTLLVMLWIWRTLRQVVHTPDRDWLLSVSAGLLVGSLFVPYLTIFPIGTLFCLLIGGMAAYYEGYQGA